jgi:hypothetical protein
MSVPDTTDKVFGICFISSPTDSILVTIHYDGSLQMFELPNGRFAPEAAGREYFLGSTKLILEIK